MRRALGAGLALLLAAGTGRADPATPQLDAAHLQREDAQRIDEQQRQVDANAPSLDAEPPVVHAPPPAHDATVSGYVLLGLGGGGAVLSGLLLAASAIDDLDSHPTRNTIAAIVGVASIGAASAGIALVITGRERARKAKQQPITMVPLVRADGLGLAALGRF